MKIAVCFSGQVRGIENTYKSIINFLDKSFESYKIFAYIPEDSHSNKFESYFSTSKLLIEKDKKILNTKLKLDQFKSVKHKFGTLRKARAAHMLQLYGIFKANEMKRNYEVNLGTKFDWVLRCRSDLRFYTDKINIKDLNNQYLYTPNFHQFNGINDRFILGNSKNMDTFCDLYNYIKKYKVEGYNAETIFKNYLNIVKLENLELNIQFNRVRQDGTELKDFM